MRRRAFRHRVLTIIVALFLIAASVVAIVHFATRKEGGGKLAEALVVKASLSSSISSAGEIRDVSVSAKVPLAIFTAEKVDKFGDIEHNDYIVNLPTLLGENGGEAVLYRVKSVGYGEKTALTLSTDDPSRELMTVAPVYFDFAAASAQYVRDKAAGETDAESVEEYLLAMLFRTGGSDIDTAVFPSSFWREDTAHTVTIKTGDIASLLLAEVSYLDKLTYKISNLVWDEGDMLMLDNDVFSVSYAEKFVAMTLSEYDVAPIHERMRTGERVYAAVSVNALAGRDLLSEIVEIGSGSSVSGVTYYSVMARLIFPEITENPDGTELGSYAYYDEFLNENNVKYLGINLKENAREEELIAKNSVTVTAQKTVVADALIVPTKCIYYDDDKKPYVVTLDAEKKEKRIHIKIVLSTGTDAAVEPQDGKGLKEGDVLRYTTEDSLIDSLF